MASGCEIPLKIAAFTSDAETFGTGTIFASISYSDIPEKGIPMRTGAIGLLALAALALAGGRASADPIGPSCGTCQGSIYTLEYDGAPISTTATTETFRITLSIDTSGYSGAGSYIDTVAIKVSSSLESATLFAAPGGAGSWTTWTGGLNANGCSGSGSGFDCAAAWFIGIPVPDATLYQWTWDIEMDTGILFTDPFEASIKVRYVDGDHEKVGDLVSEGITLQVIPEPASAALLGGGLLALAISRRQRR
jgi:hypothetical protein